MGTVTMPASTSRTKVLVVDDDPIVLQMVRETLERACYQVYTRERALGTAQWVLHERPDYVLLDVRMPALSGAELALLLRREETMSGAAVILHSGIDAQELNALAQSTGALGAIKKGLSPALFLAEFERVVARHRANGAAR